MDPLVPSAVGAKSARKRRNASGEGASDSRTYVNPFGPMAFLMPAPCASSFSCVASPLSPRLLFGRK
eukprot:1814174-Alexandrium_andersonii.AAC.1